MRLQHDVRRSSPLHAARQLMKEQHVNPGLQPQNWQGGHMLTYGQKCLQQVPSLTSHSNIPVEELHYCLRVPAGMPQIWAAMQ